MTKPLTDEEVAAVREWGENHVAEFPHTCRRTLALVDEFINLKVKCEAMHAVLAVIAAKADVSDEKLIESLELAEAMIREGKRWDG